MDPRALTVIITIAVVTLLLRIAPFVAMSRFSESNYLTYISQRLPVGIMLLLVMYTIKDIDILSAPFGIPSVVCIALSGVMYWRTRNSLLSIGIGLGTYLLAVNWVLV